MNYLPRYCPNIFRDDRDRLTFLDAIGEMADNYDEEKSLWEDFRHGMIIGTKEFVDRMRSKFANQTL